MKSLRLLAILLSSLLTFSAWADDGAPDPALLTALTTTALTQRTGGRQAREFAALLKDLNGTPLAATPMQFIKTSPDGGVTVEFQGHQSGAFFDPAPICQSYTLDIEGEIQNADSAQPVYIIQKIDVQYTTRAQCV